jgi:predicted AlkP superfamily pyrophosphatase or phosphodiesterase
MVILVSPGAVAQETQPRLMLLLTIDQGRGDYLERFEPVLSGGLARLLNESVIFTDAHHNHAGTVTAAGHAALSTGRHPGNSGMVGNNFFDRTERRLVYCIEDRASAVLMPEDISASSPGRSPARLLSTGLGDWIQNANANAKVFSIGAKDRAAVLMGGKNAHAAYWFDVRVGDWVSSTHYMSGYPDWVRKFQSSRHVEAYFGTTWTPVPVEDAVLNDMDIALGDGPFSHSLGPGRLFPNRAFHNAVFNSPFVESFLLDFAELVVREESLGVDDNLDVLALSFASVDTVGHQYGPNSRELLDTVLRLDRELGVFFEFLDDAVGLDNVAISLSADHGVATVPEHRESQGLPGGRMSSEDYVCLQRAGKAFELEFGDDDWFMHPLHFNEETLARHDVTRDTVEAFLARELAACSGIEKVWTRTEVEAARSAATIDPILELYAHSFHPQRSPDLYLQAKEFHIDRARGTTHGSPYTYDTHVLALIRWPGLTGEKVSDRIHTVDMPVTLAALLGVATPADVDGVSRTSLMPAPKP